jgi:hypothetical protein
MNPTRQTGLTLGGMMFLLLLLIATIYSASRVAPGYMDYWVVSRILNSLVAQPGIQSSSDDTIRTQFGKQLNMNNITQVDRSDLLIEHVPGGVKLSVAFSVKRPFIGRSSLCLDFQADASSGAAPGN